MAGTHLSVELASRNPEGTARFLESLTGWSFGRSGAEGFDYRSASFEPVRVRIGIGKVGDRAVTESGSLLVLTVEGALEEVLERVSSFGGSLVDGPIEVPDRGRFCRIRDPWDCSMGLWEPSR